MRNMKSKISMWKTVVSIFLILLLALSFASSSVSSTISIETEEQIETPAICDDETDLNGTHDDVWEPICTNITYEEMLELACFPEQPVELNVSEKAIYYDNGDIYDPPNLTCQGDDPVVYVCLKKGDERNEY